MYTSDVIYGPASSSENWFLCWSSKYRYHAVMEATKGMWQPCKGRLDGAISLAVPMCGSSMAKVDLSGPPSVTGLLHSDVTGSCPQDSSYKQTGGDR